MIATDFASLIVAFRSSGAAFRNQELQQSPHHVVIGMANQRGRVPHLTNQPDHHQRLDMMGQGGRRNLELLLQAADRHSGIAGAHQSPIDLQPGWVAQRFEMCGGVVEFHDGIMTLEMRVVNRISRIIELSNWDRMQKPA
jgi:hypothetical protein